MDSVGIYWPGVWVGGVCRMFGLRVCGFGYISGPAGVPAVVPLLIVLGNAAVCYSYYVGNLRRKEHALIQWQQRPECDIRYTVCLYTLAVGCSAKCLF